MRIIARTALFLMVLHITIAPNCLAEGRSISETVSLTVNSHPQIKAKFNEYQAQGEQLKKVASAFAPKLSVGLGIGHERSNNTTTRALNGDDSSELSRKESSISLSQMLFDGFKTHWQRESEFESSESIALSLQQLASEVAMQSIEAHLNVAASNQVFNFNIENLQTHQKIAENISARVRSGKDDYAKVHQIKARLSLSMANVAAAKNNALKASADYYRSVGSEAGSELIFQNKRFDLPTTRAGFVEDVVQFNFLVLSQKKQAKSALALAKAAENTDFPTLHFESGISWNDDLDGVEGKNNDVYLMLRLRYDLFNGGANKAGKAQAVILQQRAGYELEDTRRIVRRDAEHAWFTYQSSEERVGFLEDYVELSQLTRVAYDKQFTIGQRSLIDLLDAENELLKARLQLIAARKDLYVSKYQMLNLNGNLLESMSIHVSGS
jgi:adhesin transport system outer membrane protein